MVEHLPKHMHQALGLIPQRFPSQEKNAGEQQEPAVAWGTLGEAFPSESNGGGA